MAGKKRRENYGGRIRAGEIWRDKKGGKNTGSDKREGEKKAGKIRRERASPGRAGAKNCWLDCPVGQALADKAGRPGLGRRDAERPVGRRRGPPCKAVGQSSADGHFSAQLWPTRSCRPKSGRGRIIPVIS
jgi:hypothetical protein